MTMEWTLVGGKTKLMTINNNNMTTEVKITRNTLDEVEGFKYFVKSSMKKVPSQKCSQEFI